MTWFLKGPDDPTQMEPTTPDVPAQSFMSGISADFQENYLQSGANHAAQRVVDGIETDSAMKAIQLLGGDQAVLSQILKTTQSDPAPGSEYSRFTQDLLSKGSSIPIGLVQNFRGYRQRILDLARKDAAANPDKWKGITLSPADIQTTANKQLQKQLTDLQNTASAAPNTGIWGPLAGFIGQQLDWKNALLLAVGGEGAAARSLGATMAREAGVNMIAEGLQLPTQDDMAKRLGQPEQNPFYALGAAALFGGAFGFGAHVVGRAFPLALDPQARVDAAARGLKYWTDKPMTEPLPGKSATDSQTIVNTAQAAIPSGDPIEAAKVASDITPTTSTEPLFPDLPERPVKPAAEAPAEPVAPVEAAPAPEAPAPAKAVPEKAPQSLRDFATGHGIWKGDPLATEAAALGYKRPGFLRASHASETAKGGLTMEEANQKAIAAGYLPQDATAGDYITALKQDISAGKSTEGRVLPQPKTVDPLDRAYEEARAPQKKAPKPTGDPNADFMAKTPQQDGLFFKNTDAFKNSADPVADIGNLVQRYADEQGISLEKGDVAKVADAIWRNDGGDAKAAIEALRKQRADLQARQAAEGPALSASDAQQNAMAASNAAASYQRRFNDPTSPEAQRAQAEIIQNWRDEIAKGNDPAVEWDANGNATAYASDYLDEISKENDLADTIQHCGAPK